jgi:hypothetical protein
MRGPQEVLLEPVAREPLHLVERSRFLEEVTSSWDDDELPFAAELRECRPIQRDDLDVVASHDKQRWWPDVSQGRPG